MGDSVIGRLVYKIVGDDKELQKSLKSAEKSIGKAGRNLQKIGQGLTIGLTAPIVGIGTAMVKAAIDAEETRAKFETAFSGIGEAADKTVTELQDGYGLARQEAEKLLSNTGDLLKGFGASADEALGLSDRVQRLSVDLASYNNLQGGASRASEILTKAMLGERDALTSLGIKISENDVKQRLLDTGQQDLTGRALLLARAQATLELAYTQSGDALGDYNRTQDSTANQIRQLKADIQDISVEIGRELLPTVRAGLETVRDWVQEFQNLSDANKDFIGNLVKVAGLLAVAGPIVSGIGSVTVAVKGLIALLAVSNPVGLIATAIAAAAALMAMVDTTEQEEEILKGMNPFFADTAKTAKDLKENVKDTADEMQEITSNAATSDDLFSAMEEKTRMMRENQEAVTEELEKQQEINKTYKDYWDDVNDRWRDLGESLSVYTDNLRQIRRLDDPQRRIEELGLLEQALELDVGMLEQEKQFPVTAEARRKLLEQILSLKNGINLALSAETDLTGRIKTDTEETAEETEKTAEATDKWSGYLNDLKEDAADAGDAMATAAEASLDAWGNVFTALGEGIMDWELAVDDLKAAFKGVFIAVLKAMGEEYAIKAAVSLIPGAGFNPAAAAGYAAASAGAYTAAGMVSAFGSGGSFYTDQPQLIMVGDKPEYVNIEPVQNVRPPASEGGGGINYNFYGDLYGYEDFAEKVEQATNRAARIGRVRG